MAFEYNNKEFTLKYCIRWASVCLFVIHVIEFGSVFLFNQLEKSLFSVKSDSSKIIKSGLVQIETKKIEYFPNLKY